MEEKKSLPFHWGEIAVPLGLYLAFARVMVSGDGNGLGYFQQQNGNGLLLPLLLGGGLNGLLLGYHAFYAVPRLLSPGEWRFYLRDVSMVTAIYFAGHLVYQLTLANTLEPDLQEVTVFEWTVENSLAFPVIMIVSLIYALGRQGILAARERGALEARTGALEEQLRFMANDMEAIRRRGGTVAALTFESNRTKVRIPFSDILCLRAAGNYVEVVTCDKIWTVYDSLRAMMAAIPDGLFCQAHRSHAVNLSHVVSLTRREATLSNGLVLPVGRSWIDTLEGAWQSTGGA